MSPFPELGPSISLANVTERNIDQLVRLNVKIFPVIYNTKFYDLVLKAGPFAQMVTVNNVCVGGICCRIEENPLDPSLSSVYIQTLGVLKAFQRLGLGHLLISHILEEASRSSNPKITSIYLHVQTSNSIAIDFYEKHGFRKIMTARHYYPSMECKDAYVLSRETAANTLYKIYRPVFDRKTRFFRQHKDIVSVATPTRRNPITRSRTYPNRNIDFHGD